jgi:hypothetical protein
VINFFEEILLRSPVISAGDITRQDIPVFNSRMCPGVLPVMVASLFFSVIFVPGIFV